jgi:glutathione S-transferase
MKLYDYPASANCLKARILIAQLGLDVERVPVDLFAGETGSPEYLARNPAGRTPVLELDDGRTIPESNAILLYLAEGSDLLPADRVDLARVHGWLFFEQNLVEPNVGSARFWRLTGRDAGNEAIVERLAAGGTSALGVLDRALEHEPFLVAGRYSVADISLYAYVHVAGDAGIDLERFPAVTAWLRRVEATPGFVSELAPYPPNAMAGAGERAADA